MKSINNQLVENLKVDFELHWCAKVQSLTSLRKSKMSQSTMAALTGRSLKTVQRFENYKCKDAELMYLCNRILNK